jgi:hypothetical protein
VKLFRTASIALVLAFTSGVALADDKKPAPAPAPALSDADKADVAKWLAFFDKIVDTVVADKDACPKMAKDVNALVDANKDLLEKANAAVAAGKKLPEDAQKHMMDSAKKMMPAMQKCGADKDVQAAFMRMTPKQPAPKATK